MWWHKLVPSPARGSRCRGEAGTDERLSGRRRPPSSVLAARGHLLPRAGEGRAPATWIKKVAVLGLGLPLAGCIQPLYGNFAAGGPEVQSELQAIAIEPIPDRIGHYLGDDLIFDLNGTGSHPLPKYRLFVSLNEGVQAPIIDTVSGISTSATVVINATYRLEAFDTGLVVTKGNAFVFKSYDRTSQRFADVRAARDAEIQDAKQLADLLRLRLAAALTERHQDQATLQR